MQQECYFKYKIPTSHGIKYIRSNRLESSYELLHGYNFRWFWHSIEPNLVEKPTSKRSRSKLERKRHLCSLLKQINCEIKNKTILTDPIWSRPPKETEKLLNRRRYYYRRFRLMEILGGIFCSKCKNSDPRVLCIDHLKGGGRKNPITMNRLVYYIENPEEAKKQLQILCANCNTIKIFEKKEISAIGSLADILLLLNQYNSEKNFNVLPLKLN